ncbi:MAG: RNA polymerase factor sigma-54 [Rhizobiaceae bacterium]
MSVDASLRQTQQLTRQAIQAIEMLQFGQDELEAFLQDQCERNPLIRVENENRAAENATPIRMDAARYGSSGAAVSADSDRVFSFEATLTYRVSLRDHLHQQLALSGLRGAELAAARTIVDSLDPDGYLRQQLDDIADLSGFSSCQLENALQKVQQLEPAGIGARSLVECLTLQLRDQGPLHPSMSALLDNLHMLERGDLAQLCRRCRMSMADLSTLLAALRQLDPAPGRAFDTEPACATLPDILVTCSGDDHIRVEMNPELLPRILLDRDYYEDLYSQARRHEDKDFLRNCLSNARHLVRHLDQRTVTMLKIATAIVRHQVEFFRFGDEGLRPLSQRQIATTAKVHESTVSRAIANKNLLCERGLFPLKFFFSDGVGAAEGEEELAASVIRHRIRALTSDETVNNVLSDDAIVSMLKRDGVGIARRTVAKYRNQLRIPSSAQRKRQLQIRLLAREQA